MQRHECKEQAGVDAGTAAPRAVHVRRRIGAKSHSRSTSWLAKVSFLAGQGWGSGTLHAHSPLAICEELSSNVLCTGGLGLECVADDRHCSTLGTLKLHLVDASAGREEQKSYGHAWDVWPAP